MSNLDEPLGLDDHSLGRADASITLVEYGDYECPFCARAYGEVNEVLRRVGHDVRFAFRHFPLIHIHPHALLAAQAAEAAGVQGQFWPMHSLLFENQQALQPENLLVYAETLGLDVERFADELRTDVHLPKVEHDLETGVRSGVRGTPTFFVNGQVHDTGWDADALTTALHLAVQRGAEAVHTAHR